MIQRAYKTELDINDVQRTLLSKHAGAARFTWNWGLARRIEEYKLTGKSSSAIDQHKQLCALKPTLFPWMYEVSKWAPQSALQDLEKGFKNFFDKRARHPRFKSKKQGLGGFRLAGSKGVEITLGHIKMPRIGWLKLKEAAYIPTEAKINSITVKEKAGRWFVSVQVEEEIDVPENQGPAIGLDLGLKSLVVGSDGLILAPPKPLFHTLKKLRRLSQKHSRKQKGSSNRRKSAKKLAKLHYRISCQRSDYLHKATTQIVRSHSVVVVEDLNVKGMVKNHHLARSISDAGWGELVRQLGYKCLWQDSKLIKAGRFFPSTKTCSNCGKVKESMPLSERTYRCENCGLEIDRDLNAAKNLVKLSTAGLAETQACGDSSLEGSSKQEPSIPKGKKSRRTNINNEVLPSHWKEEIVFPEEQQ